MRSIVRPSEILAKRLEVIRSLLGPGWLGAPRRDWHGNSITSTDISVDSWRNAERAYDQIVSWLIDGLDQTMVFSRDNGPNLGVVLRETPAPGDAPVTAVDILRRGLLVRAAGMETHCQVSAYDLLQCIVPLLAYLYCLHDRRLTVPMPQRPARSLVALAAVPGAGKSVLAALLEGFSRLLGAWPKVQVIGMDGWHYPNEVLQDRWIQDESGQAVRLAVRKGSPESFDLQGLVAALDRLRAEDGVVHVPVYDRNLHEPVTGAVPVDAPIVLIEGNYLLMPRGDWEQVGWRIDAGVWLDVPLDLARRSMLCRHKDLGRDAEESQTKWRKNDWPNSLSAMAGRSRCDAMIYANADRRVRFVHQVKEPGETLSELI